MDIRCIILQASQILQDSNVERYYSICSFLVCRWLNVALHWWKTEKLNDQESMN